MYQGLRDVYPPQTEVFFLTGRDAAERILTWKYDDAQAALRHNAAYLRMTCASPAGNRRREVPSDRQSFSTTTACITGLRS